MNNSLKQLNVGCGRNILDGWINMDAYSQPGVDLVYDLESCAKTPIPLANDSVDEFLLSHVIEHIHKPLDLMQELYRVAKPSAKAVIRVPYGSSDDAFEDPTHVRQYFLNSFSYFSQPLYWRADYGYRGDWQTDRITLFMYQKEINNLSSEEVLQKIMKERNIVAEMAAELSPIKPIRQPNKALISPPKILIQKIE